MLLEWQCDDGSWEPGWMYQYGFTGVKTRNRTLATMAIGALASWRSCEDLVVGVSILVLDVAAG